MDRPYTHTTWVVEPEHQAEFIELWSEWVQWSRRQGFTGRAMLFRDVDDPQTFISFGPWESSGAVRNWRSLPGYQERLARLGELVARLEPRTLTIVARR
jgi:quinol monooxygenase YgiN